MKKRIKKSINSMCADASSCFPSWQIKKLKVNWLKDCTIYRGVTNEGDIVVTPVVIATDYHEIEYLMDCVTGSLYKDGKCKTSDRLQLIDFYEHPGLDIELLSMRSKALGA
jgi:hypothetical protein